VLAGLMLVAGASELVVLFLGLELISIPTYVLLSLGPRARAGQEATLKYFFLSILSSAVLLYGFSLLYSVTGVTQLREIYVRLDGAGQALSLQALVPLAFLLIVAGLGFKIAAVPFHFYAPDVYEGTSYLNAGLLAVVPKVAGLVALIRVTAAIMPAAHHVGWQVFLVLALLTMTLGNAVALWQSNIRRLLAYSSIAHTGYLLIGVTVWTAAMSVGDVATSLVGLSATLLYLVVYAVASLGTFAALSSVGDPPDPLDKIDGLVGLSKTNRGSALMIAVFMFSLMGLPPLAGFWGKLGLFAGAVRLRGEESGLFGYGSLQGWLLFLAIAGVLNAAVAAAYYLRVVAVMYFVSPGSVRRRSGGLGAALATACCAAAAVLIGVYPGPLVKATEVVAVSAAVPVSTELSSVPVLRGPPDASAFAGHRAKDR
jgi:NADH-quinone oxidoreductase subunit N